MNPDFSRSERNNYHSQTHGDTTESNGEMYYMDPNNNPMMSMSPVTVGRQSTNRNPSSLDACRKSVLNIVKMDLRERTDTAQIMGDQPIKSLVVSIPSRGSSEERMECSPKTINIGDSREQAEYNMRTANVRRSPRGGVYQTYTNIEQGNIAMEQPMHYSGLYPGSEPPYQMGSNDSNVMISSMGGQIRHSPQGSMDGITYGTMNPRQGRDPMLNRFSPNQNNIDDINSSGEKSYEPQVQMNNMMGNSGRMHVRYANDMGSMNMNEMLGSRNSINNDRIGKNSEIRYNNATYNNMTMGDVKKIVKRFTKVYDPKKTKEGTLINENQVTIPGADDDVFKGRYRVLQRMNRLSNILLSKRVENSPDRSDINNSRSFEDTRKTFDRHTLNRVLFKRKE